MLRRSSGSPPVSRIFATPRVDEELRDARDLLEGQQLRVRQERVVGVEDVLRHAVDAAEVAAVGDRDAQVVQRPAARVGERPRRDVAVRAAARTNASSAARRAAGLDALRASVSGMIVAMRQDGARAGTECGTKSAC